LKFAKPALFRYALPCPSKGLHRAPSKGLHTPGSEETAMTRSALIAFALFAVSGIAEAQPAGDARAADLVQSGKLRTALFLPQYTKDAATGEVRGLGMGKIALEVSRALATRLGIEMQVIEQPTPSMAVECLKTSACDVMFLGIESSRLTQVDFTPSVAQFDYTYLVPSDSPIRTIADADRVGGHIATVRGHAAAMVLAHTVKHAEIIGTDLPDAAFDLLLTGKADAFALPREQLLHYSAKLPGSRVLEEAYGVNRTGIAIRKGQPERLAYISEFLEEAKASGLIQGVIERNGLRGFQVSPRGSVDTH
jgi:polar amino acid transport system substrate-binding protein